MTTETITRIRGGIHGSVRHDSAEGHVTGRAPYLDDVPTVPGTLEAALLLSPHAHARIVAIDTSNARAMPGVAVVLSAADIPGKNDIAPLASAEPLLAEGEVPSPAQPLVPVAAPTLDQARAAAKAVVVEYEMLPAVLTVEDALARELYVAAPQVMRRGDVDAVLSAAPHRLSGEIRSGGQEHFYLEGQIALAVPGDAGDIAVTSSTQHPTEVQHAVAHVLGLSFNAVTAEVRRMGGGFGGKESQASIIAAIAALAAWKARRPAKLRLPRDDDMTLTGKRHPFLFRYDVAFDGEGRIQGLDLMMAANGGAVTDHTPAVVTRALCHADNCYFIPALRFTGLSCKTNTQSNTAFRGYGGPQAMLAIETIIEAIARHLGLPVATVRARNYYGVGSRDETPYGMKVEDNIIDRVVSEFESAIDLEAWRAEIDAFNRTNPILKKGLATMPIKFGISFNRPALNQAGALVNVYTDGSVLLNHGGTEMGQGLFVKVAQVVAETFQIDIDNIRPSATSTAKVPNTSPTAASSGSDLNGMAALAAATEIKGRMTGVAAEHFGVAAGDIRFEGNRVYAGNRSLSFAELAALSWENRVSLSAAGFYKTPKIHWDFASGTGRPFYYFTYGMAAAEVAIDTLTGEVRALRAELLQDCGKSLNPAIDLGQIEGAFVQGMGWLTTEELWWDDKGRLRTHGPSTYKIPGSRDVPPRFNVRFLEDSPNREETIFRSKAIGEPPLMLALAVWLAIRDAVSSLSGQRLAPELDAPATPERVLAAVDAMRAAIQ
jgi:xanthine dehydrogenase large subunit